MMMVIIITVYCNMIKILVMMMNIITVYCNSFKAYDQDISDDDDDKNTTIEIITF